MSTNSFNPNDYALKKLSKIYTENRSNIVFWFGAGASAAAGLPSWNKLREKLVTHCYERIQSLSQEEAEKEFQELENLSGESSNWIAFDVFKRILGKSDFLDVIGEELVDKFDTISAGITKVYEKAWSLRINGAVSLNIDPLCDYAHRVVRRGEVVSSFHGYQADEMFRYVNAVKPFILHAHGKHDSPSSWIFTKSDIDDLLSRQGYRKLVENIFQNYTVIFVGITATDVAAGGLLRSFVDKGIVIRTHYWITDQNNPEAARLASKLGISRIFYDASLRSHEDCICEILDYVKLYNAKEPPPLAIKCPVPAVPPAEDISALIMSGLSDRDHMRQSLSSQMEYVLQKVEYNTESPEYHKFRRDYKDALKLCWDCEIGQQYLGYKVIDKCGGRNSSDVYHAVSESDRHVAIKVLKMDRWQNPLYASSFRRGVESLSILSEKGISSASRLLEAHEVPQALVMEYIDGVKLTDVVNAGSTVYSFWEDGVQIAISIAENVIAGHQLDEGVLHRDLRPSNIVLEKFYYDEDDRHEVRLLNYDLSWHKMSTGGVGLVESEISAYHAPEQISDVNGKMARSALVDSYGFGMLLFFLFTGDTPPILGSKNSDWMKIIRAAFRPASRGAWRSANVRLGRTIARATEPEPDARLRLPEVLAELEFLRDARASEMSVDRADCWAEELICRAGYENYSWDEARCEARHNLTGSREVMLKGDLQRNKVVLEFMNNADESTDRTTLSKMWKKKSLQAKQIFESGGWIVNTGSGLQLGGIVFFAECSVATILNDVRSVESALIKALSCISLD